MSVKTRKFEWMKHPEYTDCWTATFDDLTKWSIVLTGTVWIADRPVEGVRYNVRHNGHGLAYRDTVYAARRLAQQLQLDIDNAR